MSEENSPFTVTLKAGASFDAPWLVLRADDERGLAGLLQAVPNIAPHLSGAAKALQGSYSPSAAQSAPAPRAAEPAPAPAAPASPWDDAPAEPTPAADPWSTGADPFAASSPSPAQGGGKPARPANAPTGPRPGTADRALKNDPYYKAWAPTGATAYEEQPFLETPRGNKSGLPMVWKTGTNSRGPWRAYMSSQGQGVSAADKDGAVFYD